MIPLRAFVAAVAMLAGAKVFAAPAIDSVSSAQADTVTVQQFALADKPTGYDAAIRVAEAHNCSSYIGLEYQAAGGAIYSTFCPQGLQGMIKCELDNCRMME